MIILDTNVVSELMRPAPSSAVVAWLDAQNSEDIYLCAVVSAELLFGAMRLPSGVKRERLLTVLNATLEQDFAGKILPFDWQASQCYAALCAQQERLGQPIGMADAQIAAICAVNGAAIATRNVKHFQGLGITVVNPWSD